MQTFHRRDFLRISSVAGASALIQLKTKAAQEKKNVLFRNWGVMAQTI
jgi:hypothetical protein